jgi:hypothetical protein
MHMFYRTITGPPAVPDPGGTPAMGTNPPDRNSHSSHRTTDRNRNSFNTVEQKLSGLNHFPLQKQHYHFQEQLFKTVIIFLDLITTSISGNYARGKSSIVTYRNSYTSYKNSYTNHRNSYAKYSINFTSLMNSYKTECSYIW